MTAALAVLAGIGWGVALCQAVHWYRFGRSFRAAHRHMNGATALTLEAGKRLDAEVVKCRKAADEYAARLSAMEDPCRN